MRSSTRTVFAITVLVFIVTVKSQFSGSFDTSCGNSASLENVFTYGRYCLGILNQWYRDVIEPGFYYRGRFDPVQFQNTSQQWDDICRWSWNMARCYESILPQCKPGIGVELLNSHKFFLLINRQSESSFYDSSNKLFGFYRKTCTGDTLKSDIKQRIEDVTLDVNTTCLNTTHQEEFNNCAQSLIEEGLDSFSYINSNAKQQTLNKAAEASVNCMYSVINRSPCNEATKLMLYHVARLQLPSFIDDTKLALDESTTLDFSSYLRCTVGVYGDPHLRMCFEQGLTTCSAVGPQTLIANGWFIVAGEHQTIGRPGNPPATSLRSVLLIFYSLDSTRLVATYTASVGNLPAVFDGGANSTVAGTGNDEVIVTSNGYMVEFVQQSTGMILKLRQWSGNYFFTLRVAQGVIKKSYGLLATGCPPDQVIYRSTWRWFSPAARRKRAVTKEMCEVTCNNTITDDTLRATCAFDCLVVDNLEFGVNMTSSVEVDEVEIVKRDEAIRARAVTVTAKPTPTPKPNRASSTLPVLTLVSSSVGCLITWFLQSTMQSYI